MKKKLLIPMLLSIFTLASCNVVINQSTTTNTITPTTASNNTSTNTENSTTSKTTLSYSDFTEKAEILNGITIKKVIGYGEGAYLTFDVESGSSYNAYVKNIKDNDYTKIDNELIRINGDSARVDALGLKPGEYTIKIENKNDNSIYSISKSFLVYEQDRSGYAHFNYSNGVGAYNDDGTLKENAVIVYVNEQNKNTVNAEIGGKTYTGLSNIIQNATNNKYPVDVRIIGTISAATWNPLTVSNYYDSTNKVGINPSTAVKGANNKYLELKNYSEEDIINGGFNTLNTTTYSKLNGLTNKIKYDSSKLEFDSYYNMLDVTGAKNVTIEGIGEDAKIFQWGFTWKSCNSIEVKNLTFENYTEDACSFEGSGNDANLNSYSSFNSKNYWVHNNTFNEGINYWDVCSEQDKHDGDGSTDLKKVAFVTLSYNEYYKTHKTGLVGGGDTQKTAAITFHHNYYNQCRSRLPFARQANMHMYNNYYNKSTGNNMQIYAGAYAFIENCYFNSTSNTFTVRENTEGTGKPAVKSYNNIFNSCSYSGATIVSTRTQEVSNGNIYGSSFDTNSTLFYYDTVNKKSNVAIMDEASELPTIIPNVSGAGKNKGYIVVQGLPETTDEETKEITKTLTKVFEEDFSSSKTITKTDSIPTSSGIYYHISDNEDNSSNSEDSKNYVNISNNSLNIHDESETTTTWAYYIFNNTYNSGIVKYTVEFTPTKAAGNWSPVIFLGESNRIMLRSDSTKAWGYSTDGANTYSSLGNAYSINKKTIVSLTMDFDNNKIILTVNDEEIKINQTPFKINGISFMTAKKDAERSFTVSNIKIEYAE